MTKTEAIEQLQNCIDLIKQDGQDYLDDRDIPLLNMAIEALQIDIVRCKDCKHRETDDCPMYWEEWLVIEDCDGYADDKYVVHDYTTNNGYCSYGERK